MRRCSSWIVLAPCAIAIGCAGGSSGPDAGSSALVAFTPGACKKEAASALTSTLVRALGTGVESADYEGLQCVAWSLDGQGKFDLLNFDSACGADWIGAASFDESGGVVLTVNNPSCAVAGCGSCIFDFSFTVDRVKAEGDVAVAIDVIVCDKPGETSNNASYSLTIPAAKTPDGIVCRYADWSALQWQAFTLGTAGQLHMPCVDPADYPGDGEPPPPCDDGLVCTKMQPGAYRDAATCLAACETDADCPLPDLVACLDGACRLTSVW
jgi:hypothetical protein